MKNKLKSIRNEHHITQVELADLLDVSQQLVAAWEKGRSTPRPLQMQGIEEYFNVPKEEIFFGAFNYKIELKNTN